MSSNPTIYIDIIHTPKPDDYDEKNPNGRWQPWSAQVKGANNRVLFITPEHYTNRDDLDGPTGVIALAFSAATNIYLREAGKEPRAIRLSDAAHAANIEQLSPEAALDAATDTYRDSLDKQ